MRLRFSLPVTDISRSVTFYRAFFDIDESQSSENTATFELDDPALAVRLVRQPPGKCAALSTPGLQLASKESVVAFRERLDSLGFRTHTSECVHCGYNEQFKVHVGDPDGNHWAIFHVDRQIHPREIHRSLEGTEARLEPLQAVRVWEGSIDHRNRVDYFDEATLYPLSETLSADVADAFRSLSSRGRVVVHTGTLAPEVVMKSLTKAGFVSAMAAPDSSVIAFKPVRESSTRRSHLVIYKGPFREAIDDLGNLYPRGQRIAIDDQAWTLLRQGDEAENFLFLFPYGYPAGGPVRPTLESLS